MMPDEQSARELLIQDLIDDFEGGEMANRDRSGPGPCPRC